MLDIILDTFSWVSYGVLALVVLLLVVVLAGKGWLSWATYLYLLRVPLLVAGGILGFLYVAFITSSDARLLLYNAFDIESYLGIFLVSFIAFLSVSAVEIAWRLIYLYGDERFFVEVASEDEETVTPSTVPSIWPLPVLVYVMCNLIAILVVIGTIVVSTNLFLRGQCEDLTQTYQCTVLDRPVAVLLCVLGGIGLYALLMIVLTRIQLRLTRPFVAETYPGGVLFLPAAIWRLEFLFGSAREMVTPIGTEGPPSWLLQAHSLSRGYILHDANGNASVAPGHVAALFLLGLTGFFYIGAGWFDYINVKEGNALNIPALGYVLLLFTLLCWLLSSLTFFLDRYRIPVLIPLVLVLLATSHWWRTEEDYLFQTIDSVKPTKVSTPAPTSIVVVAANGGGIQSAAWTARVLTGLEEECREYCDRSFAESVHLISSVSGGSVGTMYFANEYKKNGSFPEEKVEWDAIVGRAEESSLDHIAWGLLYPDLLRTLWPYEPEWDRGRALQKAWLRLGTGWDNSKGIERGLSKWQKDADLGRRPAVIFNATVAETGKPLALATTDLPDEALTRGEFLGEKTDVSVVTAARLSAAYPYVSPATRAEPHPVGTKKTTYHVVDGGYYDNFGVSSLVNWLDEELKKEVITEKEQVSIEKVLVVQIRGAPSEVNPIESVEGENFGVKPTGTNVVTDAALYRNGQALRFTNNTVIAKETVSFGSQGDVVLWARGGQSGGSPTLSVNVDGGTFSAAQTISNSGAPVAYTYDLNVSPGSHTIGVRAGNTDLGRYPFLDYAEGKGSGQDLEKKRGWFYQALAPGYTALNVRGAGQSAHAKTELDLLIDKWCGNDLRPPEDERQCIDGDRHVDIKTAVFEFDGLDPPLSWHLTNQQKQAIEEGWTAELCSDRNRREGWDKVRLFLGKRGEEDRECPP